MPWTFAHPAAVLPLLRLSGPGSLSFAALVIGSMSPDFGYYFGRFELASMAHTPLGVLVVCIPTGLLVLLIARWLREPVAHLLPQPHREVVLAAGAVPDAFSLRAWTLVIASLLLGAVTHLLWDAFTHEGRFFVQYIEALRGQLFTVFNREFRVFNLLQHASTILGCALLGRAYYRHARTFGTFDIIAAEDRGRYLVLASIALAAFVCAVPFAWADAMNVDARLFISMLLVRQLIYATTAFFILLAIVAFWRGAHRNV